MEVVKVGGPVYRIGVGGGAASSVGVQGDNSVELDFGAVQRGDAEMEQKMNRVIRACIESSDGNIICSIHDQGAGGNGELPVMVLSVMPMTGKTACMNCITNPRCLLLSQPGVTWQTQPVKQDLQWLKWFCVVVCLTLIIYSSMLPVFVNSYTGTCAPCGPGAVSKWVCV